MLKVNRGEKKAEQPKGLCFVIFIFCVLSEKTPRNLFEVCTQIEGHGKGI